MTRQPPQPHATPAPHVLAAAHVLLRARQSHQLAAQPLWIETALEAYWVNEFVATNLNWQGKDAARHWKSGGPARNADLSHAALDPQGVWPSPAHAPHWPLHHGGVEAEMALRLGRDVDAAQATQLTETSAPHLVDALCVAIEVISSRLAHPDQVGPWDRMADAQSHGALVLGPWVPWQSGVEMDWAAQSGELQVNQQQPKRFTGTHSLNDPFYVLTAWLRHATRNGQVVRAGTVVTTGNWSGGTPVQQGDRVCVRFSGLGEAVVQL